MKYSPILKDIAEQIENLRVEIFRGNIIKCDNDKLEFDDLLFKIQSRLRFDAKAIIEYWEDE